MQAIIKLKVLRKMLQIAQRPQDTNLIFELSNLQNKLATDKDKKYLVEKIYTDHPELGKLFQEKFIPPDYNLEELMNCPNGSLGKEYALHMKRNNLKPDFYDKFAANDKWNYLRYRMRQTHDIWHVLGGFSTHYIGETELQAFYMGQLVTSLSVAIIICFWFHSILERNYSEMGLIMQALHEGYEIGKNTKPIVGIKWEELWNEPLSEIRQKFNIKPAQLEIASYKLNFS